MDSQQGGSSPNGSVGLLLAVRQLDDMEATQAEKWLEAELEPTDESWNQDGVHQIEKKG